MKLEFIICDDNEKSVLTLYGWVNSFIEKKNIDVKRIIKATKPSTILNIFSDMKKSLDSFFVFILDIDLKCETSGIAIAEMVKDALPNRHKIIFITAHSHLSLEIINRHIEPFAYLVKPLHEDIFMIHLSNLYDNFKKMECDAENDGQVITLEANGSSHYVYVKDILYIETAPDKDKYIIAHTIKNERIYHYATLAKVYEKLNYSRKRFERCHKSYLINIEYVKGIDTSRQVVKVGNIELPVSRDKKVQNTIKELVKIKFDKMV